MSSDHGQVIWQVRPSKASGLMSDDLGTISLSPLFPEKLFYGCNGHGFCLDQNNGEILWETSLKKTGWNNVSILPFSPESIIMGSQGYCCALDPSDGKIMWENKLEGTGYIAHFEISLKFQVWRPHIRKIQIFFPRLVF